MVLNPAFSFPGGFTIATMWPLVESTKRGSEPSRCVLRYAFCHGEMWSAIPATR